MQLEDARRFLYYDGIHDSGLLGPPSVDHMTIPAPHPLDYDWRYDPATVEALRPWLEAKRVLALGAPTVARRLEELGSDVTLVDRQPFQSVKRHFAQDVEDFTTIRPFDAVIADPPWYPDDLVRWASVAGKAVKPGSLILASVWPETARPEAKADLARAIEQISAWADVARLPVPLAYQLPPFEEVAIEASATNVLAASPCRGILLEIRPRATPPDLDQRPGDRMWHRFSIDGYQLALRLAGPDEGAPRLERHPQAKGWHWPYVSARAPGRDRIDLWSSAGEVAVVRSPRAMLKILSQAFSSKDAATFERHLEALPELLHWSIPRPPYRKRLEWNHRQ
jgi:hypothetical protein